MRVCMCVRCIVWWLARGQLGVPLDVEFSRRLGLELQALGVLVLECQAQTVGMNVKLSSPLAFDLQVHRCMLRHFKHHCFVRAGVAGDHQLQAQFLLSAWGA